MNLPNGLTKRQVTQILFDSYNGDLKVDTPEKFGAVIWHQSSVQSGWSLTFSGTKILHDLGFESSTWDLPNLFGTSKLIVALSRYLQYPYRLEPNQITVFGSEIRTMIALYGDFEKYFAAISNDDKY